MLDDAGRWRPVSVVANYRLHINQSVLSSLLTGRKCDSLVWAGHGLSLAPADIFFF